MTGSTAKRGCLSEATKLEWVSAEIPRGRSIDKYKSGYVKLRIRPDNPFYSMSYRGTMLEHRYVKAKSLGRALTRMKPCITSKRITH